MGLACVGERARSCSPLGRAYAGARRAGGRPRRMTLYADSSAILKRYVDEHDSDRATEWLASDPELVTGRHAIVEIRRNLARLLAPGDAADARANLVRDLESFAIVE